MDRSPDVSMFASAQLFQRTKGWPVDNYWFVVRNGMHTTGCVAAAEDSKQGRGWLEADGSSSRVRIPEAYGAVSQPRSRPSGHARVSRRRTVRTSSLR